MFNLVWGLGEKFRLYWEISAVAETGQKGVSEDIKDIQGLNLRVFQISEVVGEMKRKRQIKMKSMANKEGG